MEEFWYRELCTIYPDNVKGVDNVSQNDGKMRIAADVISTLVIDEHIPTRVMLLVNDFMAYRFKITVTPRM